MEQPEKQYITYRETRIQITTGLSSETTNHRKKMEQNLKRLKENKLSQEFSVPKTCFANVYPSWHEARQILLCRLPPGDCCVMRGILHQQAEVSLQHTRKSPKQSVNTDALLLQLHWKFRRKGKAHLCTPLLAVAAWRT